MYYMTTCYVLYVNIMPCSMLYLCDVICSWNIITIKHSMFTKNSKVKIINEECYHGKTFYVISRIRLIKVLRNGGCLCLEGWMGKGRGELVYPWLMTDWLTVLEEIPLFILTDGEKRPFLGWPMYVSRHGLVILA